MNKKSMIEFEDFDTLLEVVYGVNYLYDELLNATDAEEETKDALHKQFHSVSSDILKVVQRLCGDTEPYYKSDIVSVAYDAIDDFVDDVVYYTDHKGLNRYGTILLDDNKVAYTKTFNQIVWEKMFGEIISDNEIGEVYTHTENDEWVLESNEKIKEID